MESLENETLNLEALKDIPKSGNRLKERIIVTRDWYESFLQFHAGCKLLASGKYLGEGNNFVHMDIYLRKEMVEKGFWDNNEALEALRRER